MFVASLMFLANASYIQGKSLVAQVLLERSWNIAQQKFRRIQNNDIQTIVKVTPWEWADTWPVAKLYVPKLNVEEILLHGASGRVLAFGAGVMPGTSPIGEFGNSVVVGHKDTNFKFLQQLEVGDLVHIELLSGHVKRYIVDSFKVVLENDLSVLNQSTEDKVTLITCYPFEQIEPNTDKRYVVVVKPR